MSTDYTLNQLERAASQLRRQHNIPLSENLEQVVRVYEGGATLILVHNTSSMGRVEYELPL